MKKIFLFLALFGLLQAEDLVITFPGQYRVNFYSVENDKVSEDKQTASRFRMRQNIDIKFDERLSSSMRMQLNHTNDNITNAGDKDGKDIQVRHAYIDYLLADETKVKVGLVPVKEYQNDLLYSKSWGYNPFALEGDSIFNNTTFHYFAASLVEGAETNSSDDTNHYQIDAIHVLSDEANIILSGSYLNVNNFVGVGDYYLVAAKAAVVLNTNFSLNTSILASHTDKSLIASKNVGEGMASLFEINAKFDKRSASFLATYASGDEYGTGFLVPMSFTKTNSYWGYTGIITVMPQTDTGFDGDSVHVSNNGYGMSSLQIKSEYEFSEKFAFYFGAGWFGNTHVKNRDDTVGIDAVLMGKYKLHKYLGLDLGIAHAKIHDSLSGYFANSLNNAEGVTRSKTAVYGRLQLEF